VQAILRKKNAKRFAAPLHSRGAPEAHKSCVDASTQEVNSYGPSTDGDLQASQQVPLVALQNVENTQLNTCAEGTLQNKSTSLDHMLAPGIPSPITRPLYPPSLNMDVTCPTSPLPSFDVSQRCSPRIGQILNDVPVAGSLLHPVLSTPLKHNMLDDSSPCFRLMEELDDYGNYIEDPRKRRPVGLPCDGKTLYNDPRCVGTSNLSAGVSKQDNTPTYGKTPELSPGQNYDNIVAPIPISAVDNQGRLIVLTSQEPPEVGHTRQRPLHHSPEVMVTGERMFRATYNTMAHECNDIYNESDMLCFQKMQT